MLKCDTTGQHSLPGSTLILRLRERRATGRGNGKKSELPLWPKAHPHKDTGWSSFYMEQNSAVEAELWAQSSGVTWERPVTHPGLRCNRMGVDSSALHSLLCPTIISPPSVTSLVPCPCFPCRSTSCRHNRWAGFN